MNQDITPQLLREWPLPMPGADADKEVRGHVLIVAGSREMPGAVLLAASAALRAGAGKLTIATAASVAAHIGTAVPEARVISLQETHDGGLLAEDASGLHQACQQASAVLIGPGMQDDAACCQLVRTLLPHCVDSHLILDAAGMSLVGRDAECGTEDAPYGFRFDRPVLLTPHAGELARLTGADKQDIQAQPEAAARLAAQRWQATVALKGAITMLAAADGQQWRHEGGNAGLAISGSGDVLAGIITGLAARGATLEQAAAWGIALHALAGEQLALKHGPLGYLARELSNEVPALLRAF
ncbi:NAD(P)H-hydrate dehydratase [Duganella dendranthematis]|uniref:ADP-dependent (S)-NAD(P)H-hydrate dehydratase n=1 Tax=Duganella dendranthematis TaxID=2728021 RepID=A0ABX6MGR1_9BURK|nr:NAD(P)H-hydrate dehydratase [Duganella dendranthematis]QJD93523.1 NAD(P)H-hydrate dehydratase [Duganella dendranthematis]